MCYAMEHTLSDLIIKDINFSLSKDDGPREQKVSWLKFRRKIPRGIREKIPSIVYRETELRVWWSSPTELTIEYIPL